MEQENPIFGEILKCYLQKVGRTFVKFTFSFYFSNFDLKKDGKHTILFETGKNSTLNIF